MCDKLKVNTRRNWKNQLHVFYVIHSPFVYFSFCQEIHLQACNKNQEEMENNVEEESKEEVWRKIRTRRIEE